MPDDQDELSELTGWRLVRSGEFWSIFGSLLTSLAFFEWTARREYWNHVGREREGSVEEPD